MVSGSEQEENVAEGRMDRMGTCVDGGVRRYGEVWGRCEVVWGNAEGRVVDWDQARLQMDAHGTGYKWDGDVKR